MRLPRVRFTVRGMMVLVAIAAILSLSKRRSEFLLQAEVCRDRASDYVEGRACLKPEIDRPGMMADLGRYWGSMAERYSYAARYPWLAVGPEPPEPK